MSNFFHISIGRMSTHIGIGRMSTKKAYFLNLNVLRVGSTSDRVKFTGQFWMLQNPNVNIF